MRYFLLIIMLLALAVNAGAKGYWPGPADPTPEPTPIPTPGPDPVQTIVIEYGTRNVFANEVNFHFSKPISEYGRFNLNTAGKKYTIEGSYKDGNIEVRNSQSTTGKLVVIGGPAYATKGASVAYPSIDPLTKPEDQPEPTPAPGGGATTSKRFAHINHMSWHGQGTTIVFCAGDDVTSVTFHDTPFHFHMKDGTDKGPGREQWTNHYFQKKSETQTAGMFVWTIGGKKYQYYSDGRGDGLSDYAKHTGECYQKYN
ncbi:MAG TPA: hypothetical protein DCZ63_09090 [Geobacter sp.]|nr:hypothetical protein [Geobacter sp.]